MNAYLKSEQDNNKQVVTVSARLPYEPPALTVMGKVERLTALLCKGKTDLLCNGNLICI